MTRDAESTWVPIAALVIVATMGVAILLRDGPLESQRPPQGGAVPQTSQGDEGLMARLWQDPLHAIQTDWYQLIDFVNDYDHLPISRDLPATISSRKHEPLALRLLAIMPDTPYAEDRENRRRQRTAVVSALASQGFVPRDPEHIGYFVMPRLSTLPACVAPYSPLDRCVALVGFERYDGTRDQESRSVEVLWLSAQDFTRMDHFAALLAAMRFPYDTPAVLLGPYTSGALRAMANARRPDERRPWKELNDFPLSVAPILCRAVYSASVSSPDRQCRNTDEEPSEERRPGLVTGDAVETQQSNLQLVSSWATAPLDLLLDRRALRVDHALHAAVAEEELTRMLHIRSFRSVVARDDIVLRYIMTELKDRGACRGFPRRLAILSEQDTAYGQIFEDIITRTLKDMPECKIEVETFPYLRGLDGELPPGLEAMPYRRSRLLQGTAPEESAVWDSGDTGREHAAGVARLDYARRLATLIRQYGVGQLDETRGRARFLGRTELVAIGVLGSDLYDKLLILQALRERIPGVVTFTTDLDARLAESDNYAFTRNLLVGSTYGFTIRSRDGGQTTGFRSSYETGLHRGVVLALEREFGTGGVSPGGPAIWVPCPRLFEIGRTGAVDITRYDTECENSESHDVHGTAIYSRSRAHFLARVEEWLMVLAPILLLTVVSFRVHFGLTESRGHRKTAHERVMWLGASSVVGLVVLMWSSRSSEPWTFFEGVSSVPALVLQATAVVYAVAVYLIARGRRRQGQEDIATFFGLTEPRWARARQDGRWTVGVWRGIESVSADAAWSTYVGLGHWRARIPRVAMRVVVVGVVLVIFVLMFDTLAPYVVRDIRLWVEVIAYAMVGSVLFAILYCVDMLALTRNFIRVMARGDVVLPARGGEWNELMDDHAKFAWQRRQKMKLVADLTEVFGPVMVFPFVLLLLPVAAANTLSEGWVWTWRVVVLYGGFTLYVLMHVLMFQFEAVGAKESVIGDLRGHLRNVRKGESGERLLKLGIEEIESIRKGAFVPWTRRPIVQSIGASLIGIGTMLAALL